MNEKEMTTDVRSSIAQVKSIITEIKKVVIGKDQIIIKVLLAIISKGHILIEDIPGVGKTTLALAFSKALSLEQNRIQFTPDVLPTDVTGFSIYNKSTGNFEFKEGAAFCNLLLADEINRTSSKTQSALLEVMEEGNVTTDGITRELPNPYIVIATQNPIGSIGTQMLPESQLDRFMIRLTMGYPDITSEINIIKSKQSANPMELVRSVANAEDIINMQNSAENVYIDEKIYMYIAKLVEATRTHSLIKLGVSPRGTIALTAMAKSTAFLKGRDYVVPDDIAYIFSDVFEHRILLNSNARINNVTIQDVLKEIISGIEIPSITSNSSAI